MFISFFLLGIFSMFLLGLMSNTPLILLIILVIMALLVGISLGSLSKWLTLMVIMIYVGGMMVLFSYMVSLVEVKKPSSKNNYWLLIGFFWGYLYIPSANLNSASLGALYQGSFCFFLTGVSVYLLFLLCVVVKISGSPGGALKAHFNNV